MDRGSYIFESSDSRESNYSVSGYVAPMKFRKLRIVWSVTCAIACILLIVLWVRSYWCAEAVARVGPNWILTVGSNHGIIYFVYESPPPSPASWSFQPIQYRSVNRAYWSYGQIAVVAPARWLEWKDLGTTIIGQVPDFLLVGLCIVGAVLPWWPKRYSLRTLLIATTLVALVLGLVVYAIRN